MNLHHSGKKPDWAKRPRQRWNEWQKLAAQTGGIVTIGNIFTAVGFVGVVVGLYLIAHQAYIAGLMTVVAGRLCDVADGWLANATLTKSPLGEKFDAGIDKLETVLAVIVLVLARVLPLWAMLVLSLPQTAIGVLAYVRIRQGRQLHPSGAGKISMALAWMALAGFIAVGAVNNSPPILMVTYTLVGLSACAGIYAATLYKILPDHNI